MIETNYLLWIYPLHHLIHFDNFQRIMWHPNCNCISLIWILLCHTIITTTITCGLEQKNPWKLHHTCVPAISIYHIVTFHKHIKCIFSCIVDFHINYEIWNDIKYNIHNITSDMPRVVVTKKYIFNPNNTFLSEIFQQRLHFCSPEHHFLTNKIQIWMKQNTFYEHILCTIW